MKPSSSKTTCAHEDCECKVSASSVTRDGKRYCSLACADGRGCEHPDCGCRAESEMDMQERPAARQ